MRILFISLFHPDIVPGGAQAVAYSLFKEARDTGIDAVFLASVDPSKKQFYKPGAVITGFERRDSEFLFLVRDYDYWWHRNRSPGALAEMLAFVRHVNPDIIHIHHFLTFGVDIFALLRHAVPNARLVFTFHEFLAICAADGQMLRRDSKRLCYAPEDNKCVGCFPERAPEDFFMRKLWMRINIEECDRFIVPSAFMIDFFVAAGLDRDKFAVIENPLMGPVESPTVRQRTPGEPIRFGFFGQMVDNKGFLLLLRAVAVLKAAGKRFYVEFNGGNLNFASEAVGKEFTAALEHERGLTPERRTFEWNGEYHAQELKRLMASVDVVVVPSVWWEIYGLVISEAWAHNKPVIGSDVGGPGGRIVDDVNGVRFPVGDYRGLAAAMALFIDGKVHLDQFEPQRFLPPTPKACLKQHLAWYGAA